MMSASYKVSSSFVHEYLKSITVSQVFKSINCVYVYLQAITVSPGLWIYNDRLLVSIISFHTQVFIVYVYSHPDTVSSGSLWRYNNDRLLVSQISLQLIAVSVTNGVIWVPVCCRCVNFIQIQFYGTLNVILHTPHINLEAVCFYTTQLNSTKQHITQTIIKKIVRWQKISLNL
jgi:hypothetical protein